MVLVLATGDDVLVVKQPWCMMTSAASSRALKHLHLTAAVLQWQLDSVHLQHEFMQIRNPSRLLEEPCPSACDQQEIRCLYHHLYVSIQDLESAC